MRIFLSIILVVFLFNSSAFAQEEGFEFVNPPITLVVLGSSTAAGAGTWPIDNAWVNRYRCHVQTYNHENQVVNLAKGGYNTYHLLPTGSSTPNRTKPDTLRNITKAMEFNPVGIIINLPSNDISSGFSVKEQLDNFRTYQAYADSFGVELWVTTTQPRNFPKNRDRQLQLDLRDSLQELFPGRCIDFWTGFADSNLNVVKEYDSGDGCHLNNEGHRILTDRVIDSQAFIWKLKKTAFQRDISVEKQEEMSPHMMEVGFKGSVVFDEGSAEKRRFVKLVQKDRVLNEVEVSGTKYDFKTIVDLRHPFEVVFEAPNTLTKSVLFDFEELVNEENKSDEFYPIESLDMFEVPLENLTYHFPNSWIDVAKFEFDTSKNAPELDRKFVEHQKQRIADASIEPPVDGKKVVTYWENGNKKAVLKFKNGQLHGKGKWYREDGTKERFVKFYNGAYCGKYITFDSKGKKDTLRTFKKDEQVGETKVFD